MKNALDQNTNYLPTFYENLDKSKNKCIALQEVIFKGTPYELKQAE